MSKRKRFRPKLRGTIRPSEMLEIKKSVKISSPKKDIGQSVYPDVKIVHSALNKVVDKDLLLLIRCLKVLTKLMLQFDRVWK